MSTKPVKIINGTVHLNVNSASKMASKLSFQFIIEFTDLYASLIKRPRQFGRFVEKIVFVFLSYLFYVIQWRRYMAWNALDKFVPFIPLYGIYNGLEKDVQRLIITILVNGDQINRVMKCKSLRLTNLT